MIEPAELARRSVLELPRYKTGVSAQLLEALGAGASVTRLASNESPYGASPRVYEAIRAVDNVHRYPDGSNQAVRNAVGEHLGVDSERIMVSTGSENVLSAIFHCVVEPGDRVVTLNPTFMLAEILSKALGAVHDGITYGDDLRYDADAVANAANDAKVVYLSNPNNPTGNAFTPNELARIAEATSPSTLIVIDEAYFEYASQHDEVGASIPVLDASDRPYIVLRTFSKAYGLAGLRVGYGIAYHPELVTLVRRASTIFDVGTISQVAACAALADREYVERVVADTIAEKERMLAALAERDVRVFPALGNFVSLWFHKRDAAVALASRLAEQAVFVKALPAREGEGLVRVSVGTRDENDRFLHALEKNS